MKTDDLIQLFKWKMLKRRHYVDAMQARGITPVIKRGDCDENTDDERKEREQLDELEDKKRAAKEREEKLLRSKRE
jgi:hypothetical protein